MNTLSDIMKSCPGEEGCYGRVVGKVNPIVFKNKPGQVKVMVITEQPQDAKHTDTLKENLKNPKGNSVPKRLVELLGDEFVHSVVDEQGAFYWTHFIKCPGNLRSVAAGLNVRKCADKHLLAEIRELKPSLLICVGGQSSRWFLDHVGSRIDWRDAVIDQLCKQKIAEFEVKLAVDSGGESLKTKTMFLFHPAERSGIGWHFDSRLKNLLKKTIDSIAR